MGCFCSTHVNVLEANFDVKLPPKEAMDVLTKRENWLTIIPGCQNGTITVLNSYAAEGEIPDWQLIGNQLYIFSDTKRDEENKTLSYNVAVTGSDKGLPLDFTFSVLYTFVTSPVGHRTTINRNVTNLQINTCTCMAGCIVKGALRSGLKKENNAMVRLMGAPEKQEEQTVPPVKEEEPKAEEPKAEEPKVEEPKAEEPKAEEPKAEEPKAEEPKAEEPKAEEPKAEEPKPEEPKAEEPKTEEPKAEEPKTEEPKAEEPNAEEPKAEEPKAVLSSDST